MCYCLSFMLDNKGVFYYSVDFYRNLFEEGFTDKLQRIHPQSATILTS
jgi:hypothetical protein